jgi:hypothetical protein
MLMKLCINIKGYDVCYCDEHNLFFLFRFPKFELIFFMLWLFENHISEYMA